MKLEVDPFSLKLKKPMSSAHGVLAERRGWVVTFSAGGVSGRGEAMPWQAFGTESYESCKAAIEAWSAAAAPSSVDEVRAMTEALHATPAARFAIECALLEYLSLQRRLPLHQVLGGILHSKSIRVNALIDGEDAAILGQAAEKAVGEGFTTLKVKVAAKPLAIDAQRLLAVRNAVGPRIKIRIDANGGWSEATARAALRGMDSLDLELCEQPVVAGDVESLRRVRQAVGCRIAADESLLITGASGRVLEPFPVPAAQILVLKPMALGGVLTTLELATAAHKAGVDSFVTTMIDGPLARAAAVLVAAFVPTELAHGVSTVELFEGLKADRFTPVRGGIELYEQPGWGV